MNQLFTLLGRLIGLFVPRETPPAGTPPASTPPPPETPPGGIDPEGRPDWLPEKFWNPDIKKPRVDALARSFTELEGKLRTKTEDLRGEIERERLAKTPEKYEVKPREDFKVPEGVELKFDETDPLAQWFSGFAKTVGLTQEQFSDAITEYLKVELTNVPNMDETLKALGDHGKDRIQKVENFLHKTLGETDEYRALQPWLTDPHAVMALEKIIGKTSTVAFDGQGAAPLTEADLREMQADPRYWRDQDPVLIQKVSEGYARLYKGQTTS